MSYKIKAMVTKIQMSKNNTTNELVSLLTIMKTKTKSEQRNTNLGGR